MHETRAELGLFAGLEAIIAERALASRSNELPVLVEKSHVVLEVHGLGARIRHGRTGKDGFLAEKIADSPLGPGLHHLAKFPLEALLAEGRLVVLEEYFAFERRREKGQG